MKKLLFYFTLLSLQPLFAQQLEGDWYGFIPDQGEERKLVFHFKKKLGGIQGAMDSPDQGTYGLILDKVLVQDSAVEFGVKIFKIQFTGHLFSKDTLRGMIQLGDAIVPLLLRKSETPLPTAPLRPQEPKGPFPYKSKEVTFVNEVQNVSLAGTLTFPEGKGPFPAVVLISGSGAQNRNEEVKGHKPFWVIADYLTRKGIAVLRYDDRGVGQSEGDFTKATTADFAYDAQSAIHFLKNQRKIDPDRIGIIGHSEGGVIASMIASADTQVRFMVLIAAPGLPIVDVLLKQNEMIQELSGFDPREISISTELNKKFYDVLINLQNDQAARQAIGEIFRRHKESMPPEFAAAIDREIPITTEKLMSPWFRYFVQLNPQQFLEQVKCPVLAFNGTKDSQIEAVSNLNAIRKALTDAGNKRIHTYIMPGLNHLMQYCTNGLAQEYVRIEETFSEEILKIMGDWILDLDEPKK